jgi:hypothetical protein
VQAKRLEVAVAKPSAVEHLDFEIDALRKAVIDPIFSLISFKMGKISGWDGNSFPVKTACSILTTLFAIRSS